ncbi:hypothetical protein [Arthrobacter sp. C152]
MPTTARPAGSGWRRGVPLMAAGLAAVLMGGCSVDVRDPAVTEAPTEIPVLSTPTITPGHDAAAVAVQDLPFSAGGVLAPGVPVGISDDLKRAPGWKPVKEDVAGLSQYLKSDGCLVAARASTGQAPLLRGDDRESTVALYQYLDPTIQPGYLKTATLHWGGTAEEPGRNVEVLALEQTAPGGRATAVLARVFAAAQSSVYVSVSCPDAASLGAARTDVNRFLPVLPPSA